MIVFFSVFSVGLSAQELVVQNITPLTTTDLGEFYYPCFHPDNSRVLFTRANHTGLYLFDLADQQIVELNSDAGAGYQPVFSADGVYVYYRRQKYINRRLYSDVVRQNIEDGAKEVIINEKRLLSTPLMDNEQLVYTEGNSMSLLNLRTGRKTETGSAAIRPAVFIENTQIALYNNGKKQILAPAGTGNYIWPSLSPDATRLLFTKAGSGTYISDLSGTILHEMGYANAPQWSPDGEWIVFMVDKDDGHQILESDIYVMSSDGSKRFQLTDTPDEIEMYPQWGPDSRRIVYSTDKGQIYLLELGRDD
jgi:Tol biopolymer transport system component